MSWSWKSCPIASMRLMRARASSSMGSLAPCHRPTLSIACSRRRDFKLDAAIELKVDERMLLARIERRIAEMDARGEMRRPDDHPDVLRRRLLAYRDQTAPLVTYYQLQGVLQSVDGMAPVREVSTAIDQVLRRVQDARSGNRAPSSQASNPNASDNQSGVALKSGSSSLPKSSPKSARSHVPKSAPKPTAGKSPPKTARKSERSSKMGRSEGEKPSTRRITRQKP